MEQLNADIVHRLIEMAQLQQIKPPQIDLPFDTSIIQKLRIQVGLSDGMTSYPGFGYLLLGREAYNALHKDSNFKLFFDPSQKVEDIQNGIIGRMLGLTVLSDMTFSNEKTGWLKGLGDHDAYLINMDASASSGKAKHCSFAYYKAP